MLPIPTDEKFPEALKLRRIELGLSFKDLAHAHAVDISPNLIGRYERGETKPSADTWKKLNDYLYPESDKKNIDTIDDLSIDELVDALKRKGIKEVQLLL